VTWLALWAAAMALQSNQFEVWQVDHGVVVAVVAVLLLYQCHALSIFCR